MLVHTERVRAFDLASGELRWTFEPDANLTRDEADAWRSPSVSVEAGLLYVSDYSGQLYAVEVDTGQVRW